MEHVVAVFDKKTGCYELPYPYKHLGVAIRDFDVARKNPETKIGRHPEDYDLFHIANYCAENGTYENIKPTTLATGV